ncbi:hypothetical protein HYX18_04670 [Candidatus Woesearchaeota archaeon]|nr:hypothetical protein [Candidatus Woesearchaeota archaeon]
MAISKKSFLLLILVILFLPGYAYSFLISPPFINIDYEPGKTINWGFNIGGLKEENAIVYLMLYKTGDLNQSIQILTNETLVLKSGKWVQVGGIITLPNNLGPGTHENGVVAVQVPDKEGGQGLSALIGVKYVINVIVPYPGKYLIATLDVFNVKINQPVDFIFNLISKGKEKINKISIKLEIFNHEEVKVGELNETFENLDTNQFAKITMQWDSKNNPYGLYRAVATIDYDGNKQVLTKAFRIGDLIVSIINITGTEIKKGQIGKIIITGESQSNDFIEGAYASIEIQTKDNIIQLKSPSVNFDPFTQRDFIIYLDTSNIPSGEYKGKAKLFYYDKYGEKEFVVKIKSNFFSNFGTISIALLVIIFILLIVVILNYIKFRRYKKSKQ